ncbi:MAG: hypothetical protein HZB64_02920 [Rhodocyclales bacterium]|nr:hypothetical protein [Rhodocyclales bacterium]
MNTHNTHPLPTLSQLVKATGIALVAAAAILITVVLPAEHGIDPTGVGKALGLTRLSASGGEITAGLPAAPAAIPSPESPPVMQPAAGTVARSDVPFRSDEMQLTLEPFEGTEIKAAMRQGEQFVFSWTVQGGKVNVDMHGERPNAGDEFTSYWKDTKQTSAQGTFIAPFDGSHGWYWENRGEQPVTVKVKVSGFYQKLYRP